MPQIEKVQNLKNEHKLTISKNFINQINTLNKSKKRPEILEFYKNSFNSLFFNKSKIQIPKEPKIKCIGSWRSVNSKLINSKKSNLQKVNNKNAVSVVKDPKMNSFGKL